MSSRTTLETRTRFSVRPSYKSCKFSRPFSGSGVNRSSHPAKSAPVIQDGSVTLAESGAITEYILTKYGNGKLVVPPESADYADYLYFLHFTNGTFQPALLRARLATSGGLPEDNFGLKLAMAGMTKSLNILDERLRKSTWLAGEEFTAADIMVVFSLTTMRLFYPYSLEGYDGITAFLQRVGQRDGYQRAMAKGDPGFKPILGPEKPEPMRK